MSLGDQKHHKLSLSYAQDQPAPATPNWHTSFKRLHTLPDGEELDYTKDWGKAEREDFSS